MILGWRDGESLTKFLSSRVVALTCMLKKNILFFPTSNGHLCYECEKNLRERNQIKFLISTLELGIVF